jgi:hypothetical protein
MYKILQFCQHGVFRNCAYLVSKNSVTGLPDLYSLAMNNMHEAYKCQNT